MSTLIQTTTSIQNQNPELTLLETICHEAFRNTNSSFLTIYYVLNNKSEFQISNTNFNMCPTIIYIKNTQEFYLKISFFKKSFKTVKSIQKHLNYIKSGVSLINNYIKEYNTTYHKAIEFLCSHSLYSQYSFKYKLSNPDIMCNYSDDLICYLLGSKLTAKQYKNYFYLTNNNILPICQ